MNLNPNIIDKYSHVKQDKTHKTKTNTRKQNNTTKLREV
jgi:hypothetical protein